MANDEQEEPGEQKHKTVDFREHSPGALATESVRYLAGRVRSIAQQKESAAREVAQIITWTFAVCAGSILFGLYRILRYMPAEAKDLILGVAVPSIKEAGLFLSSTFGPLLAFVLGYYFGEKRREEDKKLE